MCASPPPTNHPYVAPPKPKISSYFWVKIDTKICEEILDLVLALASTASADNLINLDWNELEKRRKSECGSATPKLWMRHHIDVDVDDDDDDDILDIYK